MACSFVQRFEGSVPASASNHEHDEEESGKKPLPVPYRGIGMFEGLPSRFPRLLRTVSFYYPATDVRAQGTKWPSASNISREILSRIGEEDPG